MEIRVNHLRKEIAGRELLRGIDFSLKKGEALALRGGNGSGKTTLLRILSGLDKAYSGEFFLSAEKEKKIGYVSQDIVLFPEFSVFDNMSLFLQEKLSKKEREAKIVSLAEELGFRHLLKKRSAVLSGGQKRLVHIGMTLIGKPDFLFLDEVVVGLDEGKIRLLVEYLLKLRENKIMILTSHQEEFLNLVSNCRGQLKEGEITVKKDEN